MSDPTPIAVTSRTFSRHAALRGALEEHYPNVTYNDDGVALAGDALVDFLRGHPKAITALERLDGAVFRAVPELEVVSKFGVGLDSLDLDDFAAHGVRLGWTGGVNKRSVSELVIAFAISLLRHVPEANAGLRDGIWHKHVGRQLSDRAVGIIGCGHIGKDLTVLLRAFGCSVLAHDVLDFPEFYAKHNVRAVGLEVLLKEADIVTLHVPLDDSTRGMISAERLELLKPGAVLINAARGGLVDETALKTVLREGRIAAAAFDVFAMEPPEDTEFLNLSNFLATPHIGGSAEEAVLAMGHAAIAGLDDNAVPGPELRGKG